MSAALSGPSARRAFASASEVASASTAPPVCSARSISGTPAKSGIAAAVFRPRMSVAMKGSRQGATPSLARIARGPRRRSASRSAPSATLRKRCRAATSGSTARNQGKLSTSVPSRSKTTSR